MNEQENRVNKGESNEKFSERLLRWWQGRLGTFCLAIFIVFVSAVIASAVVMAVWKVTNGTATDVNNFYSFIVALLAVLATLVYYGTTAIRGKNEKGGSFSIAIVSILVIAILAMLAVEIWPNFSISETPVGDILSFLVVILAFIAAINYLLYKLNQKEVGERARNMQNEAKKLMDDERRLARAEAQLAQSYILGILFDPSQAAASRFLEDAISHDEIALAAVEGLDKERYGKIVYRAKNFLAYDLTEKRRATGTVYPDDKERALRIARELWELTTSGEAKKYTRTTYSWKETVAWVKLWFSDDQKEKDEALDTVRRLKEKVPPEWFERTREKYQRCGFTL